MNNNLEIDSEFFMELNNIYDVSHINNNENDNKINENDNKIINNGKKNIKIIKKNFKNELKKGSEFYKKKINNTNNKSFSNNNYKNNFFKIVDYNSYLIISIKLSKKLFIKSNILFYFLGIFTFIFIFFIFYIYNIIYKFLISY